MLLKGDDNTKIYHILASGRHCKAKIVQLEQDDE
jgi:hypothetical protein